MEKLGHNPEATAEELFKAREGFDLKSHLTETKDAPRVSATPPASEFANADANRKMDYGPLGPPPRRANELPKVFGSGAQNIDMEELSKNLLSIGYKIVPVESANEAAAPVEAVNADPEPEQQ